MNRLMTLDEIEQWLRSLSPKQIVAKPNEPEECLVANALRDKYGVRFTVHTAFSFFRRRRYYKEGINKPLYLSKDLNFLAGCFDRYFGHELATAEDVLVSGIIDRVRGIVKKPKVFFSL